MDEEKREEVEREEEKKSMTLNPRISEKIMLN